MSLDSEQTRLAVIEVQLKRVVSDMESEKRTRSESNKTIIARLDDSDRARNIGIGVLLTLQVIVPVLMKVWGK